MIILINEVDEHNLSKESRRLEADHLRCEEVVESRDRRTEERNKKKQLK